MALPLSNKLKRFPFGSKPASKNTAKRDLPLLPFEGDPSGQPISKESSLVFPNEDDKFTLTELVDGYAALFPLRVRVTKGYCEDHGESSAIAVDELYNLHFVKRAKVVSINDIIGNKYVIPVNSVAKFGLIQEQGIRIYSTVEDIMNASVLPQIVAARAGYVGDNNNSVLRNEILVIQGVVKAGGKFKIGRSTMLKVFSITNNVEKILSKEVFGKFTTDPFCTQIYLREFLEYIKDPTPNKVRLFWDFESEQPLPDHMIAEEVSLNYIYMETSVIASSFSEDELNSPLASIRELDSNTVNIPITLDIEVSVILAPDDDNYEKLTEETRLLLINFDPTAGRHIKRTTEEGDDNYDDVHSYTAQNQFFRCVRQGFESEGLKIEIPNMLKELALPLMSHDRHQMGKVRKENKVEEVKDDDLGYLEAEAFERPPKLPLLPSPKVVKKSRAELPPEQPPLCSPRHQITPENSGPPVSKRDSSTRKMIETLPNYVNNQRYTDSVAVNDAQHPISTHQRLTEKPIVSKPLHMNMSVPFPLPHSTKTRAVEDEEGDSNCKKIEFPSVLMQDPIELKGKPDIAGSLPERLNDVIARVEVLEKIQQQPHSSKMLDGLLEHTRELESIKESRDKIKKLEKKVKDLEMKVMEMMKTLSHQRLDDQEKEQGVSGARGDNTNLTYLDTAQILQLLQLMNMSKYLKVFQEARIDGAILAECDDDILENELCVSSKLDRRKLLLVISGKKQVADILLISGHM